MALGTQEPPFSQLCSLQGSLVVWQLGPWKPTGHRHLPQGRGSIKEENKKEHFGETSTGPWQRAGFGVLLSNTGHRGEWQYSLPGDAVLPRQQAERPLSTGKGCSAHLLTPSLPTIFSS